MSEIARFFAERAAQIREMGADEALRRQSLAWLIDSAPYRYCYNFTWLGRPVIQFPQDIVALQEIVWRTRPEVIVETGVAHGGSLVLHASLLALLGGDGFVVGVDIEIRPHNREAIEAHPLASRIRLVEGSSIDPATVAQVRALVAGRRALVVLDSMHTHDHVARELELYSPLVGAGSYLVVLDTVIDDMPKSAFPDRPWGPGNNPKTAVRAFLATNPRFEVDRELDDKLLVTAAPEGYLRCLRD